VPESASTSEATQRHPAPQDDDVCALASSTERAKHVVANGQISLDSRLGVFTVMGSTEPRVVRLFPKTTCSCPATATCYHILAARMAVGLNVDEQSRRINITLLRSNKRKRADKASGRKKPRVRDVDVVAANDGDDDVASQLVAAVTGNPPDDDDVEPLTAPATSSADINSVCQVCKQREPPPRKSRRHQGGSIAWVGCDFCPRWFHRLCISVPARSDYRCSDADSHRNYIASLNNLTPVPDYQCDSCCD